MAKIINEFQVIREWAKDKGIYASGDAKTQLLKTVEEVGETAKAILNQDDAEIKDGLGDILVTIINVAHLCDLNLEDCLSSVTEIITKRTGNMINGTFVKDV